MDAPGGSGIESALGELWQESRDEVLARITVLEDAAAALAAGELGPEQRERARQAAHKLRGAAGMFGFTRASETAQELEEVLGSGVQIEYSWTPRFAAAVLAMRSELEGEPNLAAPGTAAGSVAPILLVVGDSELAARLIASGDERGLVVHHAAVADATAAIAAERPDLVVADASDAGTGPGTASVSTLLAELTAGEEAPPVLVIARSDSLVDRVELVRNGARGFLDGALSPDVLAAAVEDQLSALRERAGRVLAVDDDPTVLAAIGAMLEAHGFQVVTADRPDAFWDRLENDPPDLAIVDLDMPQVNGIELCRAVRADARYSALPLLILTSYRESEVVRSAFDAGVDDYLAKPIIEEELVGRVRNRLERVRGFEHATRRDELTGLPTRSAVTAELERRAKLAETAAQPLAVVLVDVDDLGAVNSERGLAAGDRELIRVGEALTGEFELTTLGRWDGDAFIVVLDGMSTADATRRVESVLEDFAGGAGPAISLSAGVAGAEPGAIEPAALVAAAEAGLAEAKLAGGGRTALATEVADSAREVLDVVVVEDDDIVVGVLNHALESLGYSSHRFEDGAEAVAALAGDPPALRARIVLLDWDLPGLDGLSVLRRLSESGTLAKTRVIMLTARANEDEVLKALELGAVDHVAKPFSLPVLSERLKKAFEA